MWCFVAATELTQFSRFSNNFHTAFAFDKEKCVLPIFLSVAPMHTETHAIWRILSISYKFFFLLHFDLFHIVALLYACWRLPLQTYFLFFFSVRSPALFFARRHTSISFYRLSSLFNKKQRKKTCVLHMIRAFDRMVDFPLGSWHHVTVTLSTAYIFFFFHFAPKTHTLRHRRAVAEEAQGRKKHVEENANEKPIAFRWKSNAFRWKQTVFVVCEWESRTYFHTDSLCAK